VGGLKLRANLTKTNYICAVLLSMALIFAMIMAGCGSKTASDLLSGRSQNEIASDASAPETKQTNTLSDPVSLDRKIVQKADLKMQVPDVAAAADQIIALCSQNGGYTVSSHIYRDGESVSAQLALKVPQAALLPAINSISALGEVTDKVISTQDVSEEYYDSEARLKVLKAKEERLLGLMDKAVNITEIINVENELSKTRSEIEVLSGRLQYLSNATEFSLINITLKQGVPGTVQAPQGTWGKAWQGLVNSLNGVFNFASGTVVFLFTAIPWVLILAVLGWLGLGGYKKIRARQPKQ
jgi:Domain of unknown function (DUF4349)